MKLLVLSGSPKGELSVTLRYVKYLQKKLYSEEFEYVHVGIHIQKIVSNKEELAAIVQQVKECDVVVWCFPVFDALVPAQLKQFIELISERGLTKVFKGKYATAITSSVHYFDHTAHNYIHAVSEDMGMPYVPGVSLEMNDFSKKEVRQNLLAFGKRLVEIVGNKEPAERVYPPVKPITTKYEPKDLHPLEKIGTRNVLLLTDAAEGDSNLKMMTDILVDACSNPIEVVNLHDVDIRGGCVSCYSCAEDNQCSYKDGFVEMFKEKVLPAEAVIFAGSIKDRFLSARWKMFMDRIFFNGHTPVMAGKQIAWLISGPLQQIPNIRDVMMGYAENEGMNIVGWATDESESSSHTTAVLQRLSRDLVWAMEERVMMPRSFRGAGGHLLFRDLVYRLKFFFKADHKYYCRNGLYDYPQKNFRERMRNNLLNLITAIPAVRKSFYKEARKQMAGEMDKQIASSD